MHVQVVELSGQRLKRSSGRIVISRAGWLFRIAAIISFALIGGLVFFHAFQLQDWLTLFALAMPAHLIIIWLSGWFRYKNPATRGFIVEGDACTPLVSVIIPIYNQEPIIRSVLQAVADSSYPNLEIVAINDGSTDRTRQVLSEFNSLILGRSLTVINKKNAGKRKAVAAGFRASKGSIVVLIDSDSIIDHHAISEFVKTFNAFPRVGCTVGHVKVLNAGHNMLTKFQDSFYDFQFNVVKASESVYGSVLCCSGCLAGYRRRAIEAFIPYWENSRYTNADDRELTSFAIANGSGKKTLLKMNIKRRAKEHAASYDDSDDRVLTAQAIDTKWRSVYVASAVVYTDVPENFRQFKNQQLRWKRGTQRTNFFVSLFFWKRNPIMAFLYYFELAGYYLMPIMIVGIMAYEVAILGQWWFPLLYCGLVVWKGFVAGVDYKVRDKTNRNWYWKIPMLFISTFFLSILTYWALITIRQRSWGTR